MSGPEAEVGDDRRQAPAAPSAGLFPSAGAIPLAERRAAAGAVLMTSLIDRRWWTGRMFETVCSEGRKMGNETIEPRLAGVHMTAIGAATMRAGHLLQSASPKVFEDTFALALANVSEVEILERVNEREAALGAGGSSLWALRSRYAEERLAAARTRTGQYILLGAGLDSYALRQADHLGGLLVLEVDDPPMQDWKRWRLGQLGLNLPPQLQFVPCDFETTTLVEALATSGYDQTATTFISWLGVTQYLTEDAIASTLAWAANHPVGSEIVLTYCVPGPRAEAAKALHAARGTRFSTFFTPDRMTEILLAAGFHNVEHLSIEAANQLYYRDRPDALPSDMHERLVSATV
ncbi:MAG TPA: class I SAM-dependent methyltransferase [Caulobacteraceae bacterium]|nr:class I SAM-dependent methyltransferase [Caulobacteraceae bacterium]